MAEKEGGLIEGVLGGGETEEREAEESNSRADDVATVVMMDAARFDPELSKEAKEYLRDQRALIKLQVHHFDEERRLAIDAAKRKRFFDHLRMSFQVLLTMIVAGMGFAAILMVWDAVHSKSVVIDLFDTPRALADTGVTGKTVSAGLLDVLSKIQIASRDANAHKALSSAWANEIAVEVPETGLSIGQIETALKTRFGHDQHIDGDLVQSKKGGLALTVRGDDVPAKTFSNDMGDLDKLLSEAGEYIYSQSQPINWTLYLVNNGRSDEAIPFIRKVYNGLDNSEKPRMLTYWAGAILTKGDDGAARQALPLLFESLRLQPDYWAGYYNLTAALGLVGDEEGAVRMGKQMMQVAGGRPGRAGERFYSNYDGVMQDWTAVNNAYIVNMKLNGGLGINASGGGAASLNMALIQAFLHDIFSAKQYIRTADVDARNLPDVAVAAMDKALLAEEIGDLTKAAKEWDVLAVAYANPTVSTFNPSYMCFAAPTFEKTGQTAKADAALDAPMKAVGISTFVDCYRFKGDVMELRGNWAGAKEWYTKAIKLAPSMPAGYYSYGITLLAHGDVNGAAEQFKLANLNGPHWADPLKAWGDVLMKQGHPSDALDKYDDALKYAPNWTQLKDARAAAVKAKT